MNVAVIGASGLIGSHILAAAKRRDWKTTGTFCAHPQEGMVPLHMEHPQEITAFLGKHQPDVVFLCAFQAKVDECELHPEQTRYINVEGNRNVIDAAQRAGIRIVYFSSDYVFDGTQGPYRETDSPNPLSEYGRQKLAIEHLLAERSPLNLIIRTTTVYGWEIQEKNFLYQVLRAMKNNKDLPVPTDQIGTPTLAEDLAEASLDLAERNASGIFHIAGPDLLSRFAFAGAITDAFGLPKNHLKPITTSDRKQEAGRPLKSGLLCEKASGLLIDWKRRNVYEGLSYLQSNRP